MIKRSQGAEGSRFQGKGMELKPLNFKSLNPLIPFYNEFSPNAERSCRSQATNVIFFLNLPPNLLPAIELNSQDFGRVFRGLYIR